LDTHHPHITPGQWLLRGGLFAGMAAYFAYLWISGNLGNYINTRFMWLSIVATIVFCLLAASSLYSFIRARSGGDLADGHHDDAGHWHPPIGLPVLLLLAAPLAFGLLVPSRPLGASAVGGDLMPNAPNEASLAASANSLEWTVVDWLRVFYYSGNPDRLNGREADVVGFVYRREGDPKGHFMAARFLMSCCSADAAAVGMPVAWNEADNLPVDTWVRVKGQVKVQQYGKNALPVIDAKSVDTSIGPPAQAYLYP
jgi:putative membrane protein